MTARQPSRGLSEHYFAKFTSTRSAVHADAVKKSGEDLTNGS